MNWTDRANLIARRRESRVRRVWTHSIEPAAARLRARGVDVLDSPRDSADSWYSVVDPDTPHFVEIDDVGDALARMWEKQGLPELAAAAAPIASLVDVFRDAAPQRATVDSDVYAMY